jgi:glycosyltransferase involved in cell wall biosynthesis
MFNLNSTLPNSHSNFGTFTNVLTQTEDINSFGKGAAEAKDEIIETKCRENKNFEDDLMKFTEQTVYLPSQFTAKETKITFIIPTIGRSSLINTIASLINQTDPNWKAIIVFDGIEPTIQIKDPRIKCIEILKAGIGHNSAGNVRNEGIRWVTTEWIGLLDDDDIISSSYVETFLNEINEYPEMDVIIFRMYQENDNGVLIDRILPELNTDSLYHQHVGISFAFKTFISSSSRDFLELSVENLINQNKSKILFTPCDAEDIIFLQNIIYSNYKVMISPFVRYFARNVKDGLAYKDYSRFTNNDIIGNRVFFNFSPQD